MFDIDNTVQNELKSLTEKERQETLRFARHVREHPELHNVRMWLFDRLAGHHDGLLHISLNILMFIA